MRARVNERGNDHDKNHARGNLGRDELERGQRRGTQALQEAVLSVSNDHVADTEHTTEHHVHAEYAGKNPVGVAHRIAFNLFLDDKIRRGRRGLQQRKLDEIPLGSRWIDPVTRWRPCIDQQVQLMALDFSQRFINIVIRHEADVARFEERVRCCINLGFGLQHTDRKLITLTIKRKGQSEDEAYREQQVPG